VAKSGHSGQNGGDSAQRILDVAERLVQTRGFNGFSYADIAEALDVTKASLHYHFPAKSDLGARLIEGLTARGRKVITPEAPPERAGNVCFLADDARALADRLAARKVLVWGGDGRIRVSAHLYNDADDVAAFLAAMDAVA